MASTSTVAQLTDTPNDHARVGTKSGVEQGSDVAGGSHIPRSLLYSEAHCDLAVLIWADYESLMTPALGGGRAPSVAGRRYIAEAYGTAPSAVDDARRQLLRTDVPGGAYLARSTPRGRKRTVQHMARRRPQETREAYVPVPARTRSLVWAGSHRPDGRISPSAWRLYAAVLDKATRDSTKPKPFETTVKRLGAGVHASAKTGQRRLAELEAAGLVQVTARPGGWLRVQAIADSGEAQDVADAYAEHGRSVAGPLPDTPTHPGQNPALTPDKIRHSMYSATLYSPTYDSAFYSRRRRTTGR